MILNRQDFLDFRKRIQDKIDTNLNVVLSSEELRIFDLGEIISTQASNGYTAYELSKKDAVLNFLNSFKKEFIYTIGRCGLQVFFKQKIHDVNTFG